MPELPSVLAERLIGQYGLGLRDVEVLMSVSAGDVVGYDGEATSTSAVQYFEKVAHGRDPKIVFNWQVPNRHLYTKTEMNTA